MGAAFKLLVYSPYPEDGTSLYRAWGVLPHLRKRANIELVRPGGQFTWTNMADIDAVFLQRAFLPAQVQMAHMAKTYGIPVILDYDDNLFCVQPDNPTHDAYNADASKANVEECAKLATAIMVSTEAIRQTMLKFCPNVYVVPNALDTSFLKRVSDDIPLQPIIAWRGGATHMVDLQEHTDAILEAYEKFPTFSFAFLGYQPYWILKKMQTNRVKYLQFDANYPNYMKNLQRLRAAVHIIPLADNEFNHCKSRVGHLESSFAGSTAIAPDWAEWQGGELARYKSPQEFRAKLFEALSTPLPDLLERNRKDWDWVLENRTLEKVNQIRLEVLEKHAGLKVPDRLLEALA